MRTAAFVDDMYVRNVVASGLVLYRSSGRGRTATVAVDSRMAEFLGEAETLDAALAAVPGYAPPLPKEL